MSCRTVQHLLQCFFSDNTYLCLFDKNLNEFQISVNFDLLKMDGWVHLNKSSYNISESAYMLTFEKVFEKHR